MITEFGTNYKLLLCDCHDIEHQFVLTWDNIPDKFFADEMTMMIHLSKRSFFKRLWYGLKYIIGYQSKTGSFSEIVLRKSQVKQLVEYCQNYLKLSEEFNERYSGS